jgi:hypothetical protein
MPWKTKCEIVFNPNPINRIEKQNHLQKQTSFILDQIIDKKPNLLFSLTIYIKNQTPKSNPRQWDSAILIYHQISLETTTSPDVILLNKVYGTEACNFVDR